MEVECGESCSEVWGYGDGDGRECGGKKFGVKGLGLGLYRDFKIDKKKRFKLTLEVFREILQIYPRVHGRDFDPLPPEEDIVSFLIDLEIVSPLDVPVHHEVPRTQAPTLLSIPVFVIPESSPKTRDEVTLAKASSQPQSTYEAASTLTEFELKKIFLDKMEKSESYLTAPEHRECYDGLKKSYAIEQDFFYSYDVYTLKRGRKDKDKDEDPSAESDRGLKRRKTSKDAEPTTDPKKKDYTSGSSKGTKSQLRSSAKSVQSEEPVFEVADSDMTQDQERDMGDNEDEPRKKTASRSDWFKKPTLVQEPTGPDWHKALSEKLDWENPEGGDYPFDLSKPLPLITHGKHQRVPFKFFINNDIKYLQGGISTMTYTTSTTKTKAAQYDLSGIKDMVCNQGEMCIRQSVFWQSLMSRFKKGDFPRLRINDIENMLLLVVQNRLNNLSGDDVADFAIALRMYTRSLVIQKRVKDLQLGVESYQKKINVTKPDTTR
ncbi:hypothetical protein Tco_0194240 [Tanacetum coccineum]